MAEKAEVLPAEYQSGPRKYKMPPRDANGNHISNLEYEFLPPKLTEAIQKTFEDETTLDKAFRFMGAELTHLSIYNPRESKFYLPPSLKVDCTFLVSLSINCPFGFNIPFY